jgi:hypothetical protein
MRPCNIAWQPLIGAIVFGVAISIPGQSAHAGMIITIDNDLNNTEVGFFSVEVRDAGESRDALIVAEGAETGIISADIIFDYFTYVSTDFSMGASRLETTTASSVAVTGDDEVTSAGILTGSAGNEIQWTAVSSIADGANTMATNYTFSAQTGTLGDLRLFQYLDEDVVGVSDDFLFTRGSAATANLALFTIDFDEVIGISQSGAFNAAQGLVNVGFDGWAADEWPLLRAAILSGPISVSTTGVVNEASLVPSNHPTAGPGWGPQDITTVMVWTVDPGASEAAIRTSLGALPEPSTSLLLLIAAGAVLRRRTERL